MRACIYTRVSTDDKDQNPERQLRLCREYAAKNNHRVVLELADYVSGSVSPFKRQHFPILLDPSRRIELVIVFSMDRLTRQDVRESLNFQHEMKQRGISIRSATEPIYDMSDSELTRDIVVSMHAAMNSMFLKKLSIDTIEGLRRARTNGKKLGRPLSRSPACVACGHSMAYHRRGYGCKSRVGFGLDRCPCRIED